MHPALRVIADGVELQVRVTPRAGRDALVGLVEGPGGAVWVNARVAAPPDRGRANEALLRLLAKTLDLPPTSLTIAVGATARRKRVHVAADPAFVAGRLQAVLREGGDAPSSRDRQVQDARRPGGEY